MIIYKCKYCGKEINNKGCLVLHEKYCEKNPNRIISKTQFIIEERDSRRDEFGNILVRKKFHHSEETKKILSEKRKQWLSKNKDKHPWKNNDKFISKPCEQLKEWLREQNINFVEEYEPFNDINYCLDIAWPDEKIAIEINGNQHYNRDGSLKEYYQKRHDLLERRGWKIFEIHYSKCFNIKINDFIDILKLPIYDKTYVKEYYDKKYQKQKIKEKEILERNIRKENEYNKRKQIIVNLINNSGIDFTKSGWCAKAYTYLENRNELFNKGIFRTIRIYCPEFLKRHDVWKRKRSIY